jgi:alpha-1,6-mannosyltransferase
MRTSRSTIGLLWPGVGLVGSCAVAIAATKVLAHRPTPWWWSVPLPGGHLAAVHVFWAGVIALAAAWLAIVVRLRAEPPARSRDVLVVAIAWALPIALGPVLFSLDMYSYLAQGTLLVHGLNPYRAAPAALAGFHDQQLLGTVSTSWRHTTTPYGPLFTGLAATAAWLSGGHVMLGIMLLRLVELAGLALVAAALPRLARSLGADPPLALWLALASPLTLLYLVGGGHNEAVMAGLLVAGVSLACERRPLAAIAVCSLAGAVKLPAIAAVAMIAACWLRDRPEHRLRALVASVAVCGAVLLAAGLLTGVGGSWLSGGILHTPESVRMALTPATALGVTLAHLLHHVHVTADARTLELTLTGLVFRLVVLVALWFCLRVRYATLVRYLSGVLLLAAIGGPAAWPWYLAWGALLVAADPAVQRSRWLPIVLVACAFFVMPGGQVATPLPQASRMLAVYLLACAIAVAASMRRLTPRDPPRPLGLASIAEARR